jgi:hypothetical protein
VAFPAGGSAGRKVAIMTPVSQQLLLGHWLFGGQGSNLQHPAPKVSNDRLSRPPQSIQQAVLSHPVQPVLSKQS